MEGGEGQIATGGADERGDEHVAGQLVLVRHLQGEHGTGRGGLEDGGDTRGGAGHQQDPAIVCGEEAASGRLHAGADVGADVDRRALEAHGPAEAEGGHADDGGPCVRWVEPAPGSGPAWGHLHLELHQASGSSPLPPHRRAALGGGDLPVLSAGGASGAGCRRSGARLRTGRRVS